MTITDRKTRRYSRVKISSKHKDKMSDKRRESKAPIIIFVTIKLSNRNESWKDKRVQGKGIKTRALKKKKLGSQSGITWTRVDWMKRWRITLLCNGTVIKDQHFWHLSSCTISAVEEARAWVRPACRAHGRLGAERVQTCTCDDRIGITRMNSSLIK